MILIGFIDQYGPCSAWRSWWSAPWAATSVTGAAHTADRTPAHSTRGANPARLPGRAPAAHHQEHAIAVTTNLTPPDARRGDWEIRCTSCGLVAIHPDRIAAETLASQHAAGHIDAARIRTRVRVR